MLLWWIALRAISSTTEFNLLQPPNLASQQMGGGLWSVEAILCMAAMACPGVTSPAASRPVPWPSHWAGVQLSGWEKQTHTCNKHTYNPWGRATIWVPREVFVWCVIAMTSSRRQESSVPCWAKCQMTLRTMVLSRSQICVTKTMEIVQKVTRGWGDVDGRTCEMHSREEDTQKRIHCTHELEHATYNPPLHFLFVGLEHEDTSCKPKETLPPWGEISSH